MEIRRETDKEKMGKREKRENWGGGKEKRGEGVSDVCVCACV